MLTFFSLKPMKTCITYIQLNWTKLVAKSRLVFYFVTCINEWSKRKLYLILFISILMPLNYFINITPCFRKWVCILNRSQFDHASVHPFVPPFVPDYFPPHFLSAQSVPENMDMHILLNLFSLVYINIYYLCYFYWSGGAYVSIFKRIVNWKMCVIRLIVVLNIITNHLSVTPNQTNIQKNWVYDIEV